MTEPPTTAPPVFNLWRDPWIRATRLDGTSVELGVEDCLREAHQLYGLHDPSPLVVAGTHRLLVAVLQAIHTPQKLAQIAELLEQGCFDPALIDAFATRYYDRFELFHPITPFLQTGDVPIDAWRKPIKGAAQQEAWVEPKPVTSLFPEIPSATNRALFEHVLDEDQRLCPACCARGLVTVPAFASAGGAGIRPSINGVPPIYVMPVAPTLFVGLTLALTTPGYQPRAADAARAEIAPWTMEPIIRRDQTVGRVGYLESLTFPARRMRLYPINSETMCTQCGQCTAVIVSEMLYEMGHRRGEQAGVWDDPFVAFRMPHSTGKQESGGLVPLRPQGGKALWREYGSLLLTHTESIDFRPKIVQQLGMLIQEHDDCAAIDRLQKARFRCIGIRTDGKGKYFEWIDEALEAPPPLLNDVEGGQLVREALERAGVVEVILRQAFGNHFRPDRMQGNRSEKTARCKTLQGRMLATYWQRLAPQFRTLVSRAAEPERHDDLAREWAEAIIAIGVRTFQEAAEQAGERGDALRKRAQARNECRSRLLARRKEWMGENKNDQA